MGGNRVELAHRWRRRLFHQHVQARVQRIARDGEARLRRHAECDGIKLHATAEQLGGRLEMRHVAIALARGDDGGEVEILVLGDDRQVLVLGDLAEADDGEFEGHGSSAPDLAGDG